MSKKHLTVILPNYQFDNSYVNNLLARASIKKENYANYEELLFALFNLPVDKAMPIAAIAGLGEGLNTRQNYWLCADPIELTYDLAAVYFQGNEHLKIDLAQLNDLLRKIKALLMQDNLLLHTPHPKRWYLESQQPILIQTISPATMQNKNIINALPKGKQQAYWLKLQAELQMLLSAEQKENGINSVWFWGAGKLPAVKSSLSWQHVWSNEPLSKGLALLHNISLNQMLSLKECFEVAQTPGYYLIVLDKLEEQSLSLLKTALQTRKIDKLILKINNKYSFELTKKHLYYFWRKSNRLKTLLNKTIYEKNY